MRLFVAINLNGEIRRALADAQDQFYRQGIRGNFTRAENMHLTLAFIGEYGDPQRVLDAISGIEVRPFPLALKGIGAFGDLWWAGLERSEALEGCVRRLRHALSDAGIPFDRKRFSPHITLLRRAEVDRGAPTAELRPASMTVDHISLMRSDRHREGMVYTELH